MGRHYTQQNKVDLFWKIPGTLQSEKRSYRRQISVCTQKKTDNDRRCPKRERECWWGGVGWGFFCHWIARAGPTNFFLKGQIINSLGLAGHMASAKLLNSAIEV